MVKGNLKRLICLHLIVGAISFNAFVGGPSNIAYADAANTSIYSGQESSKELNPSAFTSRIQNIIDSWEKDRRFGNTADSLPAGDDVTTKVDSTTASASAPAPAVDNNSPVQSNNNDMSTDSYDFDWQGTPLASSLYSIAKAAGRDIVINGDLTGTVYTSMHGVTCSRALDYLSRSFNFNWTVDADSNAIIISTSTLMKQSNVFQLHYVSDSSKVKDELKSIGIDDANIYANTENGSISVTGTPYQLREAAKRIKILDHPASQCLIVAQLIDISHGDSLDLGMQYTLPTYSHASGDTMTGNFLEKLTFSASANANRALSNGKVIARPMVMMLNGQEGSVSFGDKVPVLTTTTTTASTQVTVDYKDVGTTLKVLPIIDEQSGQISMKIDAEISNISQWVTSGQTKAPQISSRHATTSAHLKSGQSFVIGGLMSVNELDNLSGIPGLMNLPILGKLFSFHSKSKTYDEVYIMITPYIVSDNIDPKALIRKAGE